MAVTTDNPSPSAVRDGPEWDRAREQARKRDQYRCQYCRSHEGEWPNLDLQVHHIRPAEKGGTNDLENLVVLCNDCHQRLHRHFDDRERLPPELLDKDLPMVGFPDARVPLSNFGSCESEVVDHLWEHGPTQLKDLADAMGYSRGYVQKALQNLMRGKYVCRVSRGVYAYVTTLEYRRALAEGEDENGRLEVGAWDPGQQQKLSQMTTQQRRDAN